MSGIYLFLAIMVVAGAIEEIVKHTLRHRERMAQAKGNVAELAEGFKRFEKRLANLETIVLDREKKNDFEQALK